MLAPRSRPLNDAARGASAGSRDGGHCGLMIMHYRLHPLASPVAEPANRRSCPPGRPAPPPRMPPPSPPVVHPPAAPPERPAAGAGAPVLPSTKRQVLAQVVVCLGCCCGRTDRGRPEVPVDWLKAEWKGRRLLKPVQLTISGCLGPCDVPNVVAVHDAHGTTWLAHLTERAHFVALVDWATAVAAAGRVLPLPASLAERAFDRYLPAQAAGLALVSP